MVDNNMPNLEKYHLAVQDIAKRKTAGDYSRKTVHDINNALGKINNALWLMAREDSPSSPFFRQCQQIIEQEIKSARDMLAAAESA